ncbi:MAG TPA: hypothetical protein VKZ53_10295 [Candidatus Angelobacter sp.]|nr:hypothetical protein [Candidatus Angelobacter sp.]
MSSKPRKSALLFLLFALVFVTLPRAQETTATTSEAAGTSTPPALPPTNDPKEIIRRAMQLDQHNFDMSRNYTYEERRVVKALDKHGNEKHKQIETLDWTILYGEPYSRLTQKDDKPLSEKDEKKEQEKVDKFIDKRKNEDERDREKRLEKMEKERRQERAFDADVVNAYDFRIVNEEQVNGRDNFVIEAIPRKDFHPTQPHADMLTKVKGRVWIDKQDYGLTKLQAETVDTLSFGLFIARIHKGALLTYEQTLINNEVWLPSKVAVNGGARIMLLMNGDVAMQSDYSNYKKFTTGIRILPGVKEVEPGSRPPSQPNQ